MLEAHGLIQLTTQSQSYLRDAQALKQSALLRQQHGGKDTPAAKTPSSSLVTAGLSNVLNAGSNVFSTGSSAIGKGNILSAVAGLNLARSKVDDQVRSFWQNAADEASKHAPSEDLLKKLQTSSTSGNKELAAAKLQSAKSKLQSLRLQIQLAAASGDKAQLKRLAQEVAQAARDVADATHDLGEGAANSVADTGNTSVPITAGGNGNNSETATPGENDNAAKNDAAGSSTARTVATDASRETTSTTQTAASTTASITAQTATNGSRSTGAPATSSDPHASATGDAKNDAPAGTTADGDAQKTNSKNDQPIYAQEPPKDGDKFAWGQKALNSLSTDAENAIAQARGLLAIIASAVRNKRKSGEPGNDDDQFFNELQRSVDDAEGQVRSDIASDTQAVIAAQSQQIDSNAAAGIAAATGSDSVLGIDSVTVAQVTTTAIFLDISA